jgi:putative spermidine/putrescine transport system permease protein
VAVAAHSSASSGSLGASGRAPRNLTALLEHVGPAGFFFAYLALTLVAPTLYLAWSSVTADDSAFTLERYNRVLTDPFYLRGFGNSIKLSLLTALEATLVGALVAAAFTYAMPVRSRKTLLTLTNIATNLGGVSLAFAFIALLGTNGMLTIVLRSTFGIDLYP